MVNSIDKGKRGEREFRDLVNQTFGWTNEEGVKRTPNSGGLAIKGDLIQLKGSLNKYHWEVKNEKNVRMPAYHRQAEDDCSFDKTPVVAYKMGGKWFCSLDAGAFLQLLKNLDDLMKDASTNYHTDPAVNAVIKEVLRDEKI